VRISALKHVAIVPASQN